MNYEHELVYFGSIQDYTMNGWEPTPGLNQVTRTINGFVMVYVWMRKAYHEEKGSGSTEA